MLAWKEQKWKSQFSNAERVSFRPEIFYSLLQAISGCIEVEERVWFRKKWVRQSAMISASGILKISSPSIHGKLQYELNGARAVLIHPADGQPKPPLIRIKLDPRLQTEAAEGVSFRLVSTDDIEPWASALSTCAPPAEYRSTLGTANRETAATVTITIWTAWIV